MRHGSPQYLTRVFTAFLLGARKTAPDKSTGYAANVIPMTAFMAAPV